MRTKNVINLLLAGALTVGFAACNNDDVPNEKAGVTAVQFRVSEVKTRALTDGQTDADGVGAESLVKDGLFLTLGSNQEVTGQTPIALTPGSGVNEKIWTSKVVKYTGATGPQRATLILNAPASASNQITDADQTIAIAKLSELTAATGFTMTGTTNNDSENKIDIKKGVSETQAPTQNLFEFSVERVISKVQFAMKDANVPLGTDLTAAGLTPDMMKDYRYAVAGSANKIYLFRNHAGSRTLASDKYEGFKSAIHGNGSASVAGTVLNARPEIQKVSDLTLVAPLATDPNWGTLNSLPITASAGDTNYKGQSQGNAGIFFLENSVSDTEITGKGQLKYNDITYVKVYAKLAPTKVKKYTSGTWTDVAPTAADNTYEVSVSNEYHDTHPSLPYSGAADSWKLSITDKAGTFYRGANGELYYDLLSARKAGNPTSMKFVGGKMVWMTPANNQIAGSGDDAYTKYADTRRNNIYSLLLTRIDGLGKNYDPIDPTDPNIEKPGDNPDEPEVDPIIPVDPTETHIQVKAKILKWNLVHRGVVLK